MTKSSFYRNLHPGMGQAVAERTILRKKNNTDEWEDWGDVAHRVALGNSLLCSDIFEKEIEYNNLNKHIGKATILMSGRHLQHGDENQPDRNLEVFCNCSTAASSFILFYLLLNGSGVGRSYDDDMMLVNWDNAPNIRCVLDDSHPDFDWSAHESSRDAIHKYGEGRDTLWFKIPDSREGWAKALEIWENSTFEKIHKDKTLILDFSDVRPRGEPIRGMQNRPASGPVPLMNAFKKASTLKGVGLPPWRQAIYIDHYFAECVLVGGARRAARMSVKYWKDKTIFDFITVKRPIEFLGKKLDEIISFRDETIKKGIPAPQGFLWSSNNSVGVDQEFWSLLELKRGSDKFMDPLAQHARKVIKLISEASYADGTGEPGLINIDKLVQKDEGWDNLNKGDFIEGKKYRIEEDTEIFMSRIAKRAKRKKLHTITNPCGEIALNVLGGYCVIADVVPYHADTLEEAEEAFRIATRALIRVNSMDCIYKKEILRTNRIGVGITGIHEFAWKFFGYGFYDLIDEEKSKDFWMTLNRFNEAVYDEAIKYSKRLGLTIPHTMTTVKPSGTTSKLFGLTEGWHLPALAWYMRWVQFTNNDPLVKKYIDLGYPHKELVQYKDTIVIGFPTEPIIASLGMGDKLITASDATPEEQYKWLMLGEKYWINGVNQDGTLKKEAYGNQISYTLKYNPEKIDYKKFKELLIKYQSQIRACSVMPQIDMTAFEYQPEESITKVEYEKISRSIQQKIVEDIGKEHVDCDSGACPIDFYSGNKAQIL